MKKIFTLLFSAGVSAMGFSQAFTSGNLVVSRVGLGDKALSNASAVVNLVEIAPIGGAVIQTKTIPYHASMLTGSNNKLVTQGSSSNDANLTISGNGAYFVLTGYNADTGIATVSGVAGVKRTIARIGMDGTINTTTLLDTTRSKGNSRCATSNDGTGFWHVGSTAGLRYVPFGSTGDAPDTTTVISTSVTNFRTVQTYGGDIITGAGSGSVARVGKLTGFPTTSGQTISNFPGMPVTITANSVYMTSLPGGPAGLNTIYFADDGGAGGIKKFSLNGGTNNWDSTGIIDPGAGYRGMTAITAGGTVTLYAIKGGSPLVRFTDIAGYGVAPTVAPTPLDTVYKAPTNTALRGVQIVSGTVPVQLLSFNASKTEDNKAKVWWVISNEVNVSKYIVEKSTNGKDFIEVGTVKVESLSNYSFTDPKELTTTTYYRVKFLNMNSSFNYTNVVAVTPKKSIKVEVFPNPVSNNMIISYPKTDVISSIMITSVDGKVVMSKGIPVGTTQTSFSVSELIAGNYFVVYVDAQGNKETKQITKK